MKIIRNSLSFVTVIISLLIISCREKTEVKKVADLKKNIETKIEVEFKFPDTIYRNKSYKGEIKYSGVLDTVTTNVMEEKDGINRYIIYSFIKTNNLNYSLNQLRKMKLDTVGAIDNHTIPFYDIKFTEVGTYYLYGIINDHVTIDTNKISKPTNRVRIIENEARASHKIVVINK